MSALFNERRTAQAAAYLLHLASGRLHHLKLMKLMYLAERYSLKNYGEPLTGDSMVSMNHGPVLSGTLDRINGNTKPIDGGWETWISDKANHMVALQDASMIRSHSDLPALSESDIEALESVWKEYGHIDRFDLANLTHTICGEWRNPHDSCLPITYEDIFKNVGYSEEDVKLLVSRIEEQKQLASIAG